MSIAALRHISSLLRILGVNVWTLHAQMQQRAHLKVCVHSLPHSLACFFQVFLYLLFSKVYVISQTLNSLFIIFFPGCPKIIFDQWLNVASALANKLYLLGKTQVPRWIGLLIRVYKEETLLILQAGFVRMS